MGVNYLGGGVSNIEKPAQHYQIIDNRKAAGKANINSGVQKFDSVLKKFKTDGINKFNRGKAAVANIEDPSLKSAKAKPVSIIEGMCSVKDTNLSKIFSRPKALTLTEQRAQAQAKKDGTDIALKRLSKEMENQLYGMFWTMIDSARDADHEGGFAEKLFRGPYLTEVVKTSSDAELGEIGKAIYESLVEEKSQNKVKDDK